MSWKDAGNFLNSQVLGLSLMMCSSQRGEEKAIVMSSGGQRVDLGNRVCPVCRISSTHCKCIRCVSTAGLVLIGSFLTSNS